MEAVLGQMAATFYQLDHQPNCRRYRRPLYNLVPEQCQYRWSYTMGTSAAKSWDQILGITADTSGYSYAVGRTTSATTISTPGSFQPYLNGNPASVSNDVGPLDAFFSVFDTSGQKIYSTYFNGPGGESGLAITLGDSGSVYFAGEAGGSTNIATPGAHQTTPGTTFLTRFNLTCIQSLSQPGLIVGDSAACPGAIKMYSIAPVPGATTYTWTLPTGWSGTSTGPSITVTAGSIGGTLSVLASDSCVQSLQRTRTLTVLQPPTITASGDTSMCAGQSVTLSTPVVAGITYQWQESGVDIQGAVSATYTTSSAGNYSVKKISTTVGCTLNSPAITLTVLLVPVPVVSQSGSVLSPGTGYTTYLWYRNGQAILSAVNPSFTVTQNGTYQVGVTDTNGCFGLSSSTVICSAPPAQPSLILGDSLACPGSSLTYTIPPVPNADSYTWTLPLGWSGTSPGTSITVTVGNTGGIISVSAADKLQHWAGTPADCFSHCATRDRTNRRHVFVRRRYYATFYRCSDGRFV